MTTETEPVVAASRRAGEPVVVAAVRACRPTQWLKNVLVFAAPAAAGVLDSRDGVVAAITMFVAFCLVASGLYVWNDIGDRASDRRHPVKRHRPVASGALPLPAAVALGSGTIAAGFAIAAVGLRAEAVAILVVYAVTTMAYTFWLKHVPVIDLLIVASGFVLRAAGGAVAAEVSMSQWFVLCTIFGSLFIVTGKRYAELRDIGDGAADVRSTLGHYTPAYLRSVLTMSCTAAVLTYCLWAYDARGANSNDLYLFELSIIPMLGALLRYLLVIEHGDAAAPEKVFVSDRVLQLLGLSWLVLFAAGVYW